MTRGRTRVEIDADLVQEAMRLSGARTGRDAVAQALDAFVVLKEQERRRELRGKPTRDDDPERMPRSE